MPDRSVSALTDYDANTFGDGQFLAPRHIVEIPATYAKLAADTDGSTIQFARVPANALLLDVSLINEAITGATDADIGIYSDHEPGSGTLHDVNAIADAVTLASARTGWTSVRCEAADASTVTQRVWQLAGLTSDPGGHLRLILTGVTFGTNTGDISFLTRVGLY